jgi:hypothetical protein
MCMFANVPENPDVRPSSTGSGSMWSAAQDARRGETGNDLRTRRSSAASSLQEGQRGGGGGGGGGSTVPDLDILMTELRSITTSYEEVHKKLDSLGELIPDNPTSRHATVTDESEGTSSKDDGVMAARERALAARNIGRTTPTPFLGAVAEADLERTNSGLESLTDKIDGWTGSLELPLTPDSQAALLTPNSQAMLTPSPGPSPTTLFVNRFADPSTPTSLASAAMAFTFDGPRAHAETAAAAARAGRPHPLSAGVATVVTSSSK